MTKAFKLSNIRLDEVSLVDVPANKGAGIAIWKRDKDYKDKYKALTHTQKVRMKKLMEEGMDEEAAFMAATTATEKGGSAMDAKELEKQVAALQTQVTDLTKRADDAEAREAALVKSAEDAGLSVEKSEDGAYSMTKAADAEYIDMDGEKVLKSAVPAPLLKRLEAQETEIAKMKAREHEVNLAKRGAAELPNLAGSDLAKGKLLALASDDAEVMKSLKAADAAMAQTFIEKGSNPLNDESSATFQLHKRASDIAKAKGTTFEVAYSEVIQTAEGAALVERSRAEAN
jgi:hypothetical protein